MASKALAGLGIGLVQMAQTGIQFTLQQMRDEFLAKGEDARLKATQDFQAQESQKNRDQQTAQFDKTTAQKDTEIANQASQFSDAQKQAMAIADRAYKLDMSRAGTDAARAAAEAKHQDAMESIAVNSAQTGRTQFEIEQSNKRQESAANRDAKMQVDPNDAAKLLGQSNPLTGQPTIADQPTRDKLSSRLDQGLGPAPTPPAFTNIGILNSQMNSVASQQAPPSAVAALQANPALKDAFKAKYGYLPSGF